MRAKPPVKRSWCVVADFYFELNFYLCFNFSLEGGNLRGDASLYKEVGALLAALVLARAAGAVAEELRCL